MGNTFYRLMHRLPKAWRYRFALAVHRRTERCWFEMVMWVEFDHEFPRTRAVNCIVDCIESETCYCGKFPFSWGLEHNERGELTYQGLPIHSVWSPDVVSHRRGVGKPWRET